MSSSELADKLVAQFEGLISAPSEFRGETTVHVADAGRIDEVCQFAKNQLDFDYLVDLSSIDHYGEDPRFTLVYELYGYSHHCYLRLKTDIGEEQAEQGLVPTVTGVWRTANWHEREVYDMMGIRFQGHPDLRRILMWEGFPYYPLRKDFPLAGKPTNLPEVAFSGKAPLDGGPFVTTAGGKDAISREPRVRTPEEEHLDTNARLERRQDLGRTEEQEEGSK